MSSDVRRGRTWWWPALVLLSLGGAQACTTAGSGPAPSGASGGSAAVGSGGRSGTGGGAAGGAAPAGSGGSGGWPGDAAAGASGGGNGNGDGGMASGGASTGDASADRSADALGSGGTSGGGGTGGGGAGRAGGGGAPGTGGGAPATGGGTGFNLPALAPIPTIPAPKALGSVPLGDPATFAEVKMDFPIGPGPFQPTWTSIAANYPATDSAWLRQAKFGIWVHFGPQALGQSGDWYARKLYIEAEPAYANHIRDFGHPSVVGYKDLLQNWNPTALDPAALTKIYKDAGARFLMIQGVHHDQFDNWNSRYQPWNSQKLGPHRDLLGEWKAAIRAQGLHYGVTFHHEYSWWWWQSAFRADTTAAQGKLGVPYDGAVATLANGVGKWWQGLDPRMLYNVNLREYAGVYNGIDNAGNTIPQGIFTNHLEYAHWYVTWWALRIMDVIENYDPDFIYTDGNTTQPFNGIKTGAGYKADGIQRVLAHYFNRTLVRRGALDTFAIVKFHGKNNGVVTTFENNFPTAVKTDQPWIGEVPVGDWYYGPGFNYDPGMVIRYLLECVSRDGAAAINVAVRPDGSLDPGSVAQLQAVGAWMNINSPGIYGSRAWSKYGEGLHTQPTGKLGSAQAASGATFTTADFRFTVGQDGFLYAYCLKVPAPGAKISITSLGTAQAALAAPIQSVTLLGSSATLVWTQTATALEITCPAAMPFATAVAFRIGPASAIKP